MVSVTSASRYITSASRYHLRNQSRSSMNILGLIPLNFAELAEAAPIRADSDLPLHANQVVNSISSYNVLPTS